MKPKALLDTSFWINIYHLELTNKLSDLFDVIYITPRIYDEIVVGKAHNSSDVSLFEDMLECGKIKLIGVDEESVIKMRNYVNSSSGEAELLGALSREPTLVLLIDNSDVFWFMEQKDLTYLTTANIVITLFATGHLTHSESRARLHDLYGVLKKGVVDSAIQTLDHTLEGRK
ncbi:MAG: hypothetical protein U9N12_06350 [Euryarchaeota archaeon]|nr:hypothetical protein [Euryarchaeota archaeon]